VANAHLRYWLERALALPPTAGSHPLRACIAHFRAQFDAEHTVRKILDLNLAGQANIYFDIAFDEEILDPHEADELLNLIAGLCKGRETAADYFMFGTDWIMLAQIPHHERYVDAFDAAIKRCAFWQARREELLGGNLRRFLKLDAGPGA